MALFDIVSGPTKRNLYFAGANYENGETLYFVVQPTGTTASFRLYVQPEVLGRTAQNPTVVDLQVMTDISLVRLVGTYDLESRRGTFDCASTHNDPLVTWLGLKSRFESKLVVLGFSLLSDLKAVTEMDICRKLLLHESHGMPMTKEWASMSVDEFLQLRSRLDTLGYTSVFKGDRNSATQLCNAL